MAVGNGGYIYYSEDMGASWTVQTGAETGTVEELWDIHTPDGENIYACGDNNTVIASTDGLVSWGALTDPAASAVQLFTIQAPTEFRIIVGGEIDTDEDCLWISTDSGTTWVPNAFVGSATADGDVRRVRLAHKISRQHYVMIHGVNNGSLQRYGPGTDFRFFRTLNGGATWERLNLVANNGLNGLSVCDINLAWAAGEAVGGIGEIQRMAP